MNVNLHANRDEWPELTMRHKFGLEIEGTTYDVHYRVPLNVPEDAVAIVPVTLQMDERAPSTRAFMPTPEGIDRELVIL